MARLEARLDDSLDGSLDGSLDDMEPLLKLQREASIATSPIPTEEPSPLPPSPSLPPDELGEGVSVTTPDSPPSPLDQPAIGTLTPEVPPSPPSPVQPAIEHSEKKIMEPVGGSDSLDTLPVPLITDKTIDQNAIETVPGETDSSIETVTDAIEITNREKAAILGIDDSNLSKWVKNGEIPKKYDNKCRFNENKTKIILI
jgi:hypothetical protein